MSKRDEDEDERDSTPDEESDEGESRAASGEDESGEDESGEDESTEGESETDESETDESAEGESDDAAAEGEDALAAREGETEEVLVATQLGSQKYVFSAFFGLGIVGAYVLGQLFHTLWANFANRDFFALNAPALAAVPDESKATYSMILGGVIALLYVFRTYRKPDVRVWSTDVAGELVKVKWPTRKEVTNATIVVLATSAVATTYLFVLDRLWGFVTNLVYGTGS